MTPQEFSAVPYPLGPGNDAVSAWVPARTGERWWLHGLLFLLTLFTATIVGAGMQVDFARNVPFDIDHSLRAFERVWRHPTLLFEGLPFSLTLLGILLAHEFGHYFMCLYYRLDASPPYFLPSPFLGTFGAFIRIRTAIYSKRALVRYWGGGAAGRIRDGAAGYGHRAGVFQNHPGHCAAGQPAIRHSGARMAAGET